MNKDSVITLPHPSLRQRSQRVGYIGEEIKKLIADMQEATLDWEASRAHELSVALAAVQVNVLQRVIIIRNNFEDKSDTRFQIYINPEITKYEGELVEDYEGCLSIRDIYGRVRRHSRVRVKALNEEGRQVRLTAEGFLARVFQHEIDHTNGTVFIDHIRDTRDAFFKLNDSGELTALDYDADIKDNPDLWE
ncbi:peptide deformylase [Candidatus Saccharibacteria bacterium]|nr:MAG: peptide deformylase [Candidatus Saccharibacteria bacterium]